MNVGSIEIHRDGEHVLKVKGPHHCGVTKDGKLPVRWTIRARCAPTLGSDGFLFDQAALGEWVGVVCHRGTDESCELFAQSLGNAFIKKVMRDRPTCDVRELEVTLSPFPYTAKVTVRWTP